MHAQTPIIRDIIYGATARGADFKKICQELGLDPQALNDSDKPVPFKPAAEVWNVVIDHTKDPLLGLHLGEELSPAILGMIGYLMQSSGTLHEAVNMLIKYNDLYSTMMKFSSEEVADQILIHYDPAILWQHQYPESARQSIEISMAGMLKIFKTLSGRKIFPTQVALSYPSRSLAEYERIFQAAIHFQSKRNTLTFRKSDLCLAIISYDKSLFAFFNSTLDQKLKSLRNEERFSDRLKQMIINDFKGRPPSIDIAASHFSMTARSLQRKLKEEQRSYRDIVTDIKKELAETILTRTDFRIGEVAEILGYSDSSSFRKAFKKWSVL